MMIQNRGLTPTFILFFNIFLKIGHKIIATSNKSGDP